MTQVSQRGDDGKISEFMYLRGNSSIVFTRAAWQPRQHHSIDSATKGESEYGSQGFKIR